MSASNDNFFDAKDSGIFPEESEVFPEWFGVNSKQLGLMPERI